MSNNMKITVGGLIVAILSAVSTLTITNCGSGTNNNSTASKLETPCVSVCTTAASVGCKLLCAKAFGASVIDTKNSMTGLVEDSTENSSGEATVLTMCQGINNCVKVKASTKDASSVQTDAGISE